MERTQAQNKRLEGKVWNLQDELKSVRAQSQREKQAQQATDLQQFFTFGRQQSELAQAQAANGKGVQELQVESDNLKARNAALNDKYKTSTFNENLAMDVAVKAVALASDHGRRSSGAIPSIPKLPYHASITALCDVRNAVEAAHDSLKQLDDGTLSGTVAKDSMEDMQAATQQKELVKPAPSVAGKNKNTAKTQTKRSDRIGSQRSEADQISARGARAKFWNDRHME